jgi:hypothetical protein
VTRQAVRRIGGFSFQPREGGAGRGLAEADKTFVSKHFQIPPEEVAEYLKRKNLAFSKSGEHIKVQQCPFCHPIKGDLKNMNTLNILVDSGAHNCFRCGAKGSWFDFKKRMGDLRVGIAKVGDGAEAEAEAVARLRAGPGADGSARSAQAATEQDLGLEPSADLQNLPANMGSMPKVRDWLLSRGLEPRTLEMFGVGAMKANFMDTNNKWYPADRAIKRPHIYILFL